VDSALHTTRQRQMASPSDLTEKHRTESWQADTRDEKGQALQETGVGPTALLGSPLLENTQTV
jgi:hypothetical protein